MESYQQIVILTDKKQPKQVPDRKGDQANCLDVGIISPGLEKSVKEWSLDKKREWTHAAAVWTQKRDGKSDQIYRRVM